MASEQVATGRQVITTAKATATGDVGGAGGVVDLGTAYSKFGLQTLVTGAPTAVSATLQGSLDGTHFYTLATSTSTTGDYQSVADKPTRWIKVNLGTFTGGTTPTFTAFIGAVS